MMLKGRVWLPAVLAVAAMGWSASLAGAQTFQKIPALSFVKPYAGANPLPQELMIASTGAALRYTATATSTTGGTWLQLSTSGGNTPAALGVSVNASTSLAAGTYTGQIAITEYYQGVVKMTIPVTLTVEAPGLTFFDNLPGQVSFFLETDGNSPPSQTVQVRNGGSGTLSWTLTGSTADGGNWLILPTLSGTAPSTPTAAVNPALLPGGGHAAGTYVGQLKFQSSANTVTIPVSVTVGANVFRQVNAIDFTQPFAGRFPLSQTLAIASTGADIRFTVQAMTAKGGDWLTISATGGNTPGTVTVGINSATALAAGTYTGQVVITEYYAGSMSMTVPVTLTVAPSTSAFFDNLPGQMSFSLQTGGKTPPNQVVQIRNAGSGTLNWTVAESTADGGKWLTVSAASGTTPSNLTVGIVTAALPGGGLLAGTYVGQLMLQTASGIATIPVNVTVGDSVFEQVNGISFTKPFAGPNPLSQTVSIASTGSSIRFTVNAMTAKGGSWLTVSSTGGNTPEAITIGVNDAGSLAAGTYTGQVILTEYYSGAMSMTIPVTLTVFSSGTFFDNLPGQISFSLAPSGNAPPAQTVQIRNAGSGTLNWTASGSTSDGNPWLTISPLTGTAPSSVTVGVNVAALPGGGQVPGTFVGQMVIATAGSSVSIPVTVSVGDTVFKQVNAINFTKPFAGANPLPQVLTVPSTGGAIRFVTSAITAKGGDWLQISATGGNTPEAITVTVNDTTSLPAGTYTGEIIFTEYYSRATSMTVPVTLTVAASTTAFFDNIQGQLSYSFQPTTTNPATQSVQIRNEGTGPLTWTLTGSTSDGGNWLTVSAGSGTAPSVVTVGVNNAALPGGGLVAGTYIGELVLQGGAGRVTIPVSVTVGADVFVPVKALTFTKPLGGANPAAQTITIAGTGAAIRFLSVATAGNGGNWLTISANGGSTPLAMTVSVNTSSLPAGSYTGQIVLTEYYGASTSMTIPVYLTIGGAVGTTTSLSSSLNPATVGQTVTFTATVTPSGATGSVAFKDGSTTLATVALTGGVATYATSTLAAGTHSITAVYGGDGAHLGSTSSAVSEVVTLRSTTTALTSSLNPSQAGQTVTFRATVTGSGTGITGNVVFKDGSTALATVALTSGVASYATSTLAVGTHVITAVYGGNSQYSGSTSTGLSQVVQAAGTTTALTSSLNPSVTGEAVTFQATVTGSGGTPAGTVNFLDGTTTLGSATLTNGVASFTTAALAAGSHSIKAVYTGTNGSTSPVVTQLVLWSTTTTLTSSVNPSTVGEFVTFTATITATGTGLTGYVTFLDGSKVLSTVNSASKVAVLKISSLVKGTHTITAIYGGNGQFAGSSSAAGSQVVN